MRFHLVSDELVEIIQASIAGTIGYRRGQLVLRVLVLLERLGFAIGKNHPPDLSESDDEAVESLVNWLDEVFDALPDVEPDYLLPLARLRFTSIVRYWCSLKTKLFSLRNFSSCFGRSFAVLLGL